MSIYLLQIVEDFDPEPTVGRLSWLEYPKVFALLLVGLQKSSILRVTLKVVLQLDQVSLWHKVKYRLAFQGIVFPHIQEQV